MKAVILYSNKVSTHILSHAKYLNDFLLVTSLKDYMTMNLGAEEPHEVI
jgi:hypothetical protein